MRSVIVLALLLAGCSSANRSDGVTPGEAAALNAAADKLDAQSVNQASSPP